jgi:D-amino-acid dehydrogenase
MPVAYLRQSNAESDEATGAPKADGHGQETVTTIVVAGGGIIGLCAAVALRDRGAEVTVLDAGPPGEGASARNCGWITPLHSVPMPGPGVLGTSLRWLMRPGSPLFIQPRLDPRLALWLLRFAARCTTRSSRQGTTALAALNRRTFSLFDTYAERGMAFEQHKTALLMAYLTGDALDKAAKRLADVEAHDVGTYRVLDGDEARGCEPELSTAVVGAIELSDERYLRPDTLVHGLVDHLTRHGVSIQPGQPVSDLERIGSRVSAVRTPHDRLPCDGVLIAAGAWSDTVTQMIGRRLPLQAGKGYSVDLSPPPAGLARSVEFGERSVAAVPYEGTLRLCGTMELSGLNRRIDPRRVAAIARAPDGYLRNWPTRLPGATGWTGPRPLTPDGLPLIGRLPGLANVYVATGHAMLGMTLGPATGEAIADEITTGRRPEVLEPFDPARFGT